jgi:hypothetical protein
MKSAQEQARINRVADKLNNAKRIALTAEECATFESFNRGVCSVKTLQKRIAAVSERTGIPLSSGRLAFDSVGKSLLVVD